MHRTWEVIEIPYALRSFLLNTGTHEFELESVAQDLMARYDDIGQAIADQF
jgi:hypothetical protein